jgi:resuscitation-promoting factor RpfB
MHPEFPAVSTPDPGSPTPSATPARRFATAWRRLPRRVPGIGVLVLLAGLAVPLIGGSSKVEVRVDGEVLALRTYAESVDAVIGQLAVDLADHDELRPGPDATVHDGMRIDVARAVAVDVRVDGELVERVVAPVGSVAGVLELAGLGDVRQQDAHLVPSWTAPVFDGGEVNVWLPTDVHLEVDGETRRVSSLVADVAALLVEQAVDLGPHDLLSVHPDTPLSAVSHVAIERVEVTDEVEEVALGFDEVRETSDEVWRGTTRIAQEGRDGLRHDRYRVVTVDGVETERELVAQEVVLEPETRVVLVGTFVDWDRIAQCETRGAWSADRHTDLDPRAENRYYGGLQFNYRTWHSAGGRQYAEFPHQATREQQIAVAERLYELRRRWGVDPWGAWPACARVVGLR